MSKTTLMERIASWSINGDGLVQFRYEIDGKQFLFNVTAETKASVMREIGNLAANPKSPVTSGDAAYLTSMILEVMDMLEPPVVDAEDNSVLVGNDMYAVAWSILMMACTTGIALATFVFMMWGR